MRVEVFKGGIDSCLLSPQFWAAAMDAIDPHYISLPKPRREL